MKEKFEEIYEGKDYIDAISILLSNLRQKNDDVYSHSLEYHYNEYEVINDYIDNAGVIIKDIKNGKMILSLPRLNGFETDIQKWFNYLEEIERKERKRKIRNGISYGIGVLLAPTGIPACIIGAKKIKEAVKELGD